MNAKDGGLLLESGYKVRWQRYLEMICNVTQDNVHYGRAEPAP
jgi:hypothetical protein